VIKAEFSVALLQSSVSHFILICLAFCSRNISYHLECWKQSWCL